MLEIVFLIFSVFFLVQCEAYSCSFSQCKPPDCTCASTSAPLQRDGTRIPFDEVPQFVVFTLDDAANAPIWDMINLLFNGSVKDQRGCGARGTFYLSDYYTDYNYVQQLAQQGHEIAVHTVTHSTSKSTNLNTWNTEIRASRAITSSMAVLPLVQINGFRAPFLANSNNLYDSLTSQGITYDSSWSEVLGQGLSNPTDGYTWPYTFDFGSPNYPNTGEILSKGYPGMWQYPLTTLHKSDYSIFGTSQDPPASGDDLLNILKSNFDFHYNTNKSPFGLFIHALAFLKTDPTRIQTIQEFWEYATSFDNVFFATTQQVISWMQNPIPSSQISSMPSFYCPVPPKTHSKEICNGIDDDLDGEVDEGVTNFCNYGDQGNFHTCAACPTKYPDLSTTLQGYQSSCGNGVCQSIENCTSCPQDCGSCSSISNTQGSTSLSSSNSSSSSTSASSSSSGSSSTSSTSSESSISSTSTSSKSTSSTSSTSLSSATSTKTSTSIGSTSSSDSSSTSPSGTSPISSGSSTNLGSTASSSSASTSSSSASTSSSSASTSSSSASTSESSASTSESSVSTSAISTTFLGSGGAAQICGDDICQSSESCSVCPQDCGQCSQNAEISSSNVLRMDVKFVSLIWILANIL